MIEDERVLHEIYILHKLGYKIWEIMNLTISEKNLIINSYANEVERENGKNKKNAHKEREFYLKRLKEQENERTG